MWDGVFKRDRCMNKGEWKGFQNENSLFFKLWKRKGSNLQP